MASDNVLAVRDLSIDFQTSHGTVHALRGVSLDVPRGSILGIVGESGSGKSTLALGAMGLLPENAIVRGGEIRFDGQDVLRMAPPQLRELRGRRLSMVFQDPMTSLNPVLSISTQMTDIQYRDRASTAEKRRKAAALLRRVGIPDRGRRPARSPTRSAGA